MEIENKILSQVETLIDKLPYRKVNITIELQDKTITLDKVKRNPIGFTPNERG